MLRPYYERAGVRIYHGDCREVLPELEAESVDLVLTDPPYAMTYVNDAKKGLRGDSQRQGIRLFRSACIDLDRVLRDDRHVYTFCHWESLPDFYDAASCYWNAKNALVWNKGTFGPGDCEGDYAHDYELVLFMHKGRRLLNHGRDLAVRTCAPVRGAGRVHPTEKPVELLSFYVGKSTNAGEVVLDPFMGSGATLRAALDLGRDAIGIELEEPYCEVAAQRLQQAALPFA
jgi:site-specific DNA-methyltransferase (adenine-specific)